MSSFVAWKDGDPVPEDMIPIGANFSLLDCVRIDLEPRQPEEGLQGQVYIVFRNVGSGEHYENVRRLSNARTANLWYQADPKGMNVVDDLESVRELEGLLQYYEDEQHKRAH